MAAKKTRASKSTTRAARAVDAPKFDLHQTVTDKIVAALEAGVRPWARSWTSGRGSFVAVRPLRHNGEPYKGINVILLWSAAQAMGYASPYWMTFKQAGEYGGHVRKGETSTLVTYATRINKTETNTATGAEESKSFFVWKFYLVFNADQCDGLPERFYVKAEPVSAPQVAARVEHADAYFAAIGSEVRHGGDRAFYSPAFDRIQMPKFEQFHDAVAYYSTLGHEHVHWTGHESRLKREFQRFGTEAYAAEELVAELGAAFLCADLGLSLEPRADHAQYLANWLTVLKGDKKFIFSAASQAQRAVEHLHAAAGEAGATAVIAGSNDDAAAADEAVALAEAA